MRKSAVVSALSLVLMVLSCLAHAEEPRDCAQLEALKAQAQAQVAAYQTENAVACISMSVDFTIGDFTRDHYKMSYACKSTTPGARVTLVTVSFNDLERRPFKCSTTADLTQSIITETTDREF